MRRIRCFTDRLLNHSDIKASNEAITAVCQAMVDIAPADPVQGGADLV
jgi:hypothetical protein